MEPDDDLTYFLNRFGASNTLKDGEQEVAIIYSELRKIAARLVLGEQCGVTVQTTSLVHEAWLRLAPQSSLQFDNREHFFGIYARVMRQVLVDTARARKAAKRDMRLRVELHDSLGFCDQRADHLITLDQALRDLEQTNPVKAQLIEMRYFGGMTAQDSATALNLSVHSVNHKMRVAHAWLRRRIAELEGDSEAS